MRELSTKLGSILSLQIYLLIIEFLCWQIVDRQFETHEASREIYKWTGDNYNCCSARMRGTKKGMLFTVYGVFGLTTFSDFDRSKFWVYEAHFCAESIAASPMTIACKTGKLFAFFCCHVEIPYFLDHFVPSIRPRPWTTHIDISLVNNIVHTLE